MDRSPEAHDAQRAAEQEAQRALADGLLVREDCEECASPETIMHHDDYGQPLRVRWLCQAHHLRWHRRHEPALPELEPRQALPRRPIPPRWISQALHE